MVTEYERIYHKKWATKNREHLMEYQKEWRINNPGYKKKWVANNREKTQEYYRKWIDNHPEYKERVITSHFGSLERYEEAMLKYDGWCAFACGKKAELVHHLDGKSIWNSIKEDIDNSLKNLLPLCKSCHPRLHNTKRKRK